MRDVAPSKRREGAGPRGGDTTVMASGLRRTTVVFFEDDFRLALSCAELRQVTIAHLVRLALRKMFQLEAREEPAAGGSTPTAASGLRRVTVYLYEEERVALRRKAFEEERSASDIVREAVRAYCGEEE